MKYEVICSSLEDVYLADQAKVDRIELVSNLDLGGLTPSLGLFIEAKKLTKIPIMTMIRPRESGFFYNDFEFKTMLKDIELFLEHGCQGFVFGILNNDNTVDIKRNSELVKRVGEDVQTVFHRAIDISVDIYQSLKQLEDIGFTRILTSGQKPSAVEGLQTIKNMISMAKNIEILPGSGIKSHNVHIFKNDPQFNFVHFSSFKNIQEGSIKDGQAVKFSNSDFQGYRVVDPQNIITIKNI